MTIRKTLLGTATLAALAAAPLAPVLAQTAPAQDAPAAAPAEAPAQAPAATPEAVDFSDAELQSFVEAASEIAEIRQEFAAQIQGAQDGETVKELQEQALTEMRAAIDATDGIDVEQYNAIGAASQSDSEVNERLTAMMQQHMQKQDNGEG
ncbi:DUF4168 domain-containing protein [Ponticoccus sp. (in: a-proteobacteria)]|uniref:DUF4168 domain-containing protein n=1 Tax=Ponticoccus sp. (in: a-proteobacteria) TaxID=1925025 RepID=UPI003AB32E23